ncbi:hypothetical protein L1049_016273 [Liquidambar formosana]|uniref:PA domain-containing protein n=1 Tax=Liquidambar formosana TaxID=63359 RepID=A0AAP0X309_LIQFO
MAFSARSLRLSAIFFFICVIFAAAEDVTLDDGQDSQDASPGCNNTYQLVKVKNWVNGIEGESLVGLSARFGASLPTRAEGPKLPAIFSKPSNSCSSSSSKLSGSVALSIRGDCGFTTKAEVAQQGGAVALLVINDEEELFKMVCEVNNTSVDITIPVVMIPKSGGEAINKSMADGKKVELLLSSPNRPDVDLSVIFLWLMAVGTIVCASLWPEITACEQTVERYNELSPKESSTAGTDKDDSEKEVLDISASGAIIFVIVASAVLVLLFYFMSAWFVWLLIVLFCIGGIEVHSSFINISFFKMQKCQRKTVNLAFLGEVSVLSLGVLLFCVAFAIFWVTNLQAPYAWVGQDILLLKCGLFYTLGLSMLVLNVDLHGNCGLYPLAFAIVENKTKESSSFFFHHLHTVLGNAQDMPLTFMTDRQKGLILAMKEVIPKASSRYYARHMLNNFKAKYPRFSLRKHFWRAVRAYNVVDFNSEMEIIKAINADAYKWLKKVPVSPWSRHAYDDRHGSKSRQSRTRSRRDKTVSPSTDPRFPSGTRI